MRAVPRLSILFLAAGIAAVSVPATGAGSASDSTDARGPGRSAPPAPYRWFMVEAVHRMAAPGGGERLLELCRRAADSGYNGLLLWDANLWFRRLPPAYMENARALRRGLAELKFGLMIQMCSRGQGLVEWSGDPSIVEPRPASTTPEERHYRYLCLSHPGVLPLWEEQLRRVEQIYHPHGWLLSYDEIRVAGADERCRASGKKPGQLLAEHTRQAVALCRRVAPGSLVAVWNDMFDPHHNARPASYYHVKEGFSGSWEGLDTDVLVLNWNDSMASYDFWARRGNRQVICGYYDGEMGLEKEMRFTRSARARPGVVGYMYTTWRANFAGLRPYLSLSGFGERGVPARGSPASQQEDKALYLDRPHGRK